MDILTRNQQVELGKQIVELDINVINRIKTRITNKTF